MATMNATGTPLQTVTAPPPSTAQQLDKALAWVREGASRFVKLPLSQRADLAISMQAGYLRIAKASVEAACAAKGIPLGTALEGEEWTLGPWFVVRHLRLIRESLRSLEKTGNTRVGKLGRTADQRLSVQVFPTGPIDGLLFQGVRADVHLQAGVTAEEMENSRARFYQRPDHDGRVVLVLGGGNVNGIPPMDVLSKMFNEGKTCILKMNPVNAYLGPFLEQAFAPSTTSCGGHPAQSGKSGRCRAGRCCRSRSRRSWATSHPSSCCPVRIPTSSWPTKRKTSPPVSSTMPPSTATPTRC
jgi:hypothetical protein